MAYKTVCCFVLLVTLMSCDYFTAKKNNSIYVAKVDDAYLTVADIKSVLPKNYSKGDSTFFVTNYINTWAKEQILFQQATLNLSEEQEELNDLVNKYKRDLLINKYQEAIVYQKLDTLISKKEIGKYYNENKEIFKLNEQLISLKYLQINKTISGLKEVEELFKSDREEDILALEEKELEFKLLHLDNKQYIKYEDVLNYAAIIKENRKLIENGKFIKLTNNVDLFLIKVNTLLYRNQQAPLNYVEPTIKQMILHNRKMVLLNELEINIVNDAIKNGKFKIYE